MAVRRWTSRTRAQVRGDLESVISWWTSPERRAELREQFESLDVSDFRYEETLDGEQRVTEMGWTARSGLQVSVRRVSPARPHEALERTPDGRAVLRSQAVQTRRWPDGRERLSRTESVLEFRELSAGRTQLRATLARHREGVPWWEKVLPPNNERRHRRMHLKDEIAKCEHDLGTRKSAKRWFAIY